MIKKLVSFILFLLLLANSNITWASSSFKDIQVYYNQLRIVHNGEELMQQEAPFIYEDRIYVPLRALAEALDFEVNWDGSSYEVHLSQRSANVYIEPCDPFIGEIFVYGQILAIDYEKKMIYLEQHLDDNSREIFDALMPSSEVTVVLQRRSNQFKIQFEDVKVGDVVSLIITNDNLIRSIIVDI